MCSSSVRGQAPIHNTVDSLRTQSEDRLWASWLVQIEPRDSAAGTRSRSQHRDLRTSARKDERFFVKVSMTRCCRLGVHHPSLACCAWKLVCPSLPRNLAARHLRDWSKQLSRTTVRSGEAACI